jgi:hypothetical protein
MRLVVAAVLAALFVTANAAQALELVTPAEPVEPVEEREPPELPPVPHFNIDAQCRHEAVHGHNGMTYRSGVHRRCDTGERAAQRQLERAWGAVPEVIRRDCADIAAYDVHGSYRTLARCMDDKLSDIRRYRRR